MNSVRQARHDDVDQMVDVHLRSFQGFFLTFLGPRFLRLLYSSMVSFPPGAGFVCEGSHKAILGFVCGTMQPSGFYKSLLLKRWWQFSVAALGALLRQPRIAPRLARALLYPSQTVSDPDMATLMSIAVLPEHQGKGIGKQLVQQFLTEMQRRGMRYVNFTTDKDNNNSVNRFYHHLGFKLARSYVTPEGRPMNEYIFHFS